MEKPELLVPAGNLEALKIAVLYGADAVYIGCEMYGLRAKAKNFTLLEMQEGIKFAHQRNVKVYITANIIAHNKDLKGVKEYFEELNNIKPDAIIIADPGILMIAKKVLSKDIELHLSTQANNTNYESFKFWYNIGVSRVVAARELSIEEIKEISNNIPKDLEIEAFIHGAMCISYSGRCLLSNYFTKRDANQGACTHPCRWQYHVVEEKRPGEYLPIYENERGTFIFNSKDLCMLDKLPDLIDAGISSFKIEGRMKTLLYIATVTRIYRKAIDDYFENTEIYNKNIEYYLEEIKKCSYRPFTKGFFYNKPDENTQIYDNNAYIRNYTFIGIVRKYYKEKKIALVEQRNKFSIGDKIEIMKKDGHNIQSVVTNIYNEEWEEMDSAPHPKQLVYINIDHEIEPMDILRKKNQI